MDFSCNRMPEFQNGTLKNFPVPLKWLSVLYPFPECSHSTTIERHYRQHTNTNLDKTNRAVRLEITRCLPFQQSFQELG